MSQPSVSPPRKELLPDVDALLRQAADGDRHSERALVERLRPAIQAFARRRLRAADADEFTQDAVLVLVEALRENRITDPSMLASFALGICRNLARDRARAAERRAALWDRFGPTEPASTDGLEASDRMINRALLEDCLAQLTQRARKVLRHAFFDGDSNPEIAQALSLSEANVRVIRHRTLVQLRECLTKPLPWSQV